MGMSRFVKTTTLEWEGVVSSVIITSDTDGPYDEAIGYLTERKGMIDGVIIDCIENVSPKELIGLLKQLRSMGYRIRLVTEGKVPDVLDDLIGANYADSVMVRLDNDMDDDVIRTVSIVSKYGTECEYRTVLNVKNVTADDIARYAKMIKGAKRYVLIQPKKDPFEKKDILKAAEAAKRYVKNVIIRQ